MPIKRLSAWALVLGILLNSVPASARRLAAPVAVSATSSFGLSGAAGAYNSSGAALPSSNLSPLPVLSAPSALSLVPASLPPAQTAVGASASAGPAASAVSAQAPAAAAVPSAASAVKVRSNAAASAAVVPASRIGKAESSRSRGDSSSKQGEKSAGKTGAGEGLRVLAAGLSEAAPSGAAALSGRFFDAKLAHGQAAEADFVQPGAASSGRSLLQRSLESIRELRIGTYNVLNLFEKVGKFIPDPGSPGSMIRLTGRTAKEEWALREQAKAILESNLDIVSLQEVENIAALEDFNRRYLGGAYRTLLIEGNDPRGIDVGFLVKKDIPFEIESRTHQNETWQDPTQGGRTVELFSRDLPSLIVRAPGRRMPLFVFLGTHFKSKRDRPGDPESAILRRAQMKRAAEITAQYRAEFGSDVPLMMAGDFNGDLNGGSEFAPLYGGAQLINSLDLGDKPARGEERITHTYHPRGAPAHFAQMDGVLVSKSLAALVQRSEVYRYKNPDGTVKPIPRTYEERSRNPSDHFPLLMTLEFQPILRRVMPLASIDEISGRAASAEVLAPKPAPAPGERRMAILGMLWSFLAIASMYIVMPVRSAFLLTQHGPDVLPWVFMASAAFTGAAVWIYGRFTHRPRAQLIGGTLAVLGAGLVGWWLAAPVAMISAPTAFVFSLWTDAFSIMSVTLFWTYAADRFKGEAVKKWFGFFAAAGALGSIVGSGVTRYLVAVTGAPALLLISASTFAVIGLVFWAMEKTAYAPAAAPQAQKFEAPAVEPENSGAWATAKMIAASPFLLALTALVMFERLVPDFMQYLFSYQAQQIYTTRESMAAFMAGFGILAGVASLLMSALATRWMLKKFGVGKTLMTAPVASLLGFAAMGAVPTMPVTLAANLAEGLPRYTVFKSAKEATYTTADKNVIYRVKAYIEMFVYRSARAVSGLLLLFLTGQAFLAWGPSAVAWAAVPLSLAWIYAAWRLAREHGKAEAAASDAAPAAAKTS